MTCRYLLSVLLLSTGGTWAQSGERPPTHVPRVAEPERPANGGEVFTITLVEYGRDGPGSHAPCFYPEALSRLVAFAQKATKMDANLQWNQLPLDHPGPGLWQTSLLYLTGSTGNIHISDRGKEKLGTFLRSGGLLFAEEICPSMSGGPSASRALGVAKGTFERQLKALIGDPLVLGDQGQSWKKLRPSHPLCRSFYAFPNGAPRGGTPGGSREILETLEVQGRAAVIFSNMNISWYWGNEQVKRRERGLQFGTNLIVFAMRQQNPVQ